MSKQNSYDVVPYPVWAFPSSHPNRTAALATLFGLAPPPPGRSRVLELGCASGGNLLPMAVELPGAEFVGIDRAARQIEAGEAVRQAAGIDNVRLHCADLAEIDPSSGRFDYIIAHGLYSWVPESAQDKLLSICKENLTPDGIAYVNYNTYPGWYFRGGVRDMMLRHVSGIDDTRTRIQQARALLDFLAIEALPGPYAEMLKFEAESVRRMEDGYFYHDHLEDENHPVFFEDFVDRARARGLSYLGETRLSVMTGSNLKPELTARLNQLSGRDLVRMGQYIDFLVNRRYRESLLVHAGRAINRRLEWQRLRSLWVVSEFSPEGPAFDPTSAEPAMFVSPRGDRIRVEDPLAKTALLVLKADRPRAMAFGRLVMASRERARSTRPVEVDEAELGEFFLPLYGDGFIDVVAHPWPCVSTISDKPRTSPLARIQARSAPTVVTLQHAQLPANTLSADHRNLIALLDGEKTLGEVNELMLRTVDAGQLPENLQALASDPARHRDVLSRSFQQKLSELRDSGLLL